MRKGSFIIIEIVVVVGVANVAFDGVHDGAELCLLLVLLEELGKEFLLVLVEEGEVPCGLARL